MMYMQCFVFKQNVIIFAKDLSTILACRMRCCKFVNASLALQKWKIMFKLGQISHIQDAHMMYLFLIKQDVSIFKHNVLIFKHDSFVLI